MSKQTKRYRAGELVTITCSCCGHRGPGTVITAGRGQVTVLAHETGGMQSLPASEVAR